MADQGRPVDDRAATLARVRAMRRRIDGAVGGEATAARLEGLERRLEPEAPTGCEPLTWAICTTQMTSVAETLAFLGHHLALGVDEIFLFFDDPADAVIDAIASLERVTAVRCDRAFWERHPRGAGARPPRITERQRRNADLALLWALDRRIDWLVHIDSDEFLHVDGDFRDALARVSRPDALTIWPIEVVPVVDSGDLLGPRLFKVGAPEYLLRQFADLFGPDRADLVKFHGHPVGKAALAVADHRYRAVGIHRPVARAGVELDVEPITDASLLHYFGHDLAAWRTKWATREASGWVGDPRVGPRDKAQLAQAREVLAMSDRSVLRHFAEHRCLTEQEAEAGLALGLLRRIDRPVLASSAVRSQPPEAVTAAP